MRRFFLIVIALLISITLLGLKNWENFTNTSHIYDMELYGDDIYFATWGGIGVYSLNQQDFKATLNVNNGLSENDVKALNYMMSNDYLLCGTNENGVERLAEKEFVMKIEEEIGLVSNKINQIATRDSLIFVATENGVSVFIDNDNYSIPILFGNYSSSDGLSNNNITSIKITPSNYLLCGSSSGLDAVHLDSLEIETSWHNYNQTNSILPSDLITALTANDDYFAVASQNGILWGDDITNIANGQIIETAKSIFPLHLDDENNLWFSYGKWNENLLTVEDSSNTVITKISNFKQDNKRESWNLDNSNFETNKITRIKEINNQIYVSSWGNGLYTLSSGIWENIQPNCIQSNYIKDLAIDNNRVLWSCDGYYGLEPISRGTKGVSAYNGVDWLHYNSENSPLVNNNIMSIMVDEQNRKWFGSWQFIEPEKPKGISIYDDLNDEWSELIQLNSYSELISEIQLDNDNNRLISITGDVFIVMDSNDEIINVSELYYDTADKVVTSYRIDNKIFLGTYFEGVEYWDADSFPDTNYTENWFQPQSNDLTDGFVYQITHRNTDFGYEVWFAMGNGLVMFDGEDWYRYGINHKKQVLYSPNNWEPESIDQEGWDNTEWWYYEGQKRLYGSIATYPTALFVDPFNSIWIGTAHAGITRFYPEKNQFVNYTTDNSDLLSDYITAFAYDEYSGKLYIGTNNGLNTVEIGIVNEYNQVTNLNKTRAYPNPFYPARDNELTIENVAKEYMPQGNSYCQIYDLNGNLVIKLEKNEYQLFSWDGKNSSGKECASGIYFYIVSAESSQIDKGKIVLIR